MATLHVTFCEVGFNRFGGLMPMTDGESAVYEALTISGTNAQSSASTKPHVRIGTDTACYVAIGSNPNAQTGTTMRYWLPANSVEYFEIALGNKVAAITA